MLDPATQAYRESAATVDPSVAEILALKNPAEKFARLRASAHPQAQFLWSIFRDLFHYGAYHLADIADNARDVDLAIRWGFGWQVGPFETWQAAGWKDVAQWIAEDIAAGKALVAAPLPAWVMQGPAANGVHSAAGAYSVSANAFRPRSTLPVYRRQYFPDPVLGEKWPTGTTIMETDAVRMWHTGDDIAIVSFKTKANTIGEDVLDGLQAAIDEAEKNWRGLVIWQTREPFSVGANLAAFSDAVQTGQWDRVEAMVAKFQQTSQRLKYSLIPTVAAVRGMALGGSLRIHHALRPRGRRARVVYRPGRGRRRPASRRRRMQGARRARARRRRCAVPTEASSTCFRSCGRTSSRWRRRRFRRARSTRATWATCARETS